MIIYKRCRKCGYSMPLDEENFERATQSGHAWRAICRACRAAAPPPRPRKGDVRNLARAAAAEAAGLAERERHRIGRIIDLYDAARTLPPCPARLAAEATLELALKLHGEAVVWRGYRWSWDPFGASLERHRHIDFRHTAPKQDGPRMPRVHRMSGSDGLIWDERDGLIEMPQGGG